MVGLTKENVNESQLAELVRDAVKRGVVVRSNFEEEVFSTRAERDARWEELMAVKPHVVKDTTSEDGHMVWRVRYPRLVM